jgi:hypothetical protein
MDETPVSYLKPNEYTLGVGPLHFSPQAEFSFDPFQLDSAQTAAQACPRWRATS